MRNQATSQVKPELILSTWKVSDIEMRTCSVCRSQVASSELFPRHWMRGAGASQSTDNNLRSAPRLRNVTTRFAAIDHSAKVNPDCKRYSGSLAISRMEPFCGVCWRASRIAAKRTADTTKFISARTDAPDHHYAASDLLDTDRESDGSTGVVFALPPVVSVQPARQSPQKGARLLESLKCERDIRPHSANKAFELSQFLTADEVAAMLWRGFQLFYNPQKFVMVEPSAGTGVFLKRMPTGSLGIDLDPQHPGVVQADFLKVDQAWLAAHIALDRHIAILGNPPFGEGSELAWQFFNHAASVADVIAFILPPSVRKAGIENRLDQYFHLVAEWVVPADAFVFQGRVHNVRTIFQIWERRSNPRVLRHVEYSHPDFTFIKPEAKAELANLAIRRIGANAGQVYDDLAGKSASSHYFVQARAGVVRRLKALDLRHVAANTVSIPSLAKSEIVELYKAYLAQHRDG